MKNNNLTTKISTIATLVVLSIGANSAYAASGDSVTADATIYNQVTVSYKAVGDTGAARTASDDVSVTVSLVEAVVTITKTTTETLATSGSIVNDYTIDANANGDDSYSIVGSATANANLTPLSTNIYVTDSAGNNPVALGANVSLGSGIAINTGDATGVIEFPGGSSSDFAIGDFVELDGTVYVVAATTSGNPASDGTPEVLDTLTLNNVGGGVADLTAIVAPGEVVSERLFIRLETTGVNTDPDNPQQTTIDLTVSSTDEDGDNSNDSVSTSGTDASVVGTFNNTALSIEKTVSLDGSTYYDTGAPQLVGIKPGDTLYYKIVVQPAAGSADAESTAVTDALPAYTTMVDNSIVVDFVDGNGSNTAPFTTGNGDVELADYFAGDFRNDLLTVYLGDGVTLATGGTVKLGDVVTITYSVEID